MQAVQVADCLRWHVTKCAH